MELIITLIECGVICGLIWLGKKVPKIVLINVISVIIIIMCSILLNTCFSELFAEPHIIVTPYEYVEENIISEQEYQEYNEKAKGKLGLGITITDVMFVISIIIGLIDAILVIAYILKNDIGKLNAIISIVVTSIVILNIIISLYIFQCA